jgi:50S ribosomal subunit-associated GTPase HflX
MNELINIGIDTENEKKSFILDALGLFEVTESDEYYIKNKINELKSVINNINELEDIAKKSRSYNQFATVAIKNYRFNQALNLIDFIKDEKIKSKF